MLGRRTAAQPGIIEVIGVLEENRSTLEGVLRRAARQLETPPARKTPARSKTRTGTD